MFICKSAPRQCREIRFKISLFIAFAQAAGNIPGAVPPAKFRHAVICFIPQGVGKQPAVILFVVACALPGESSRRFPGHAAVRQHLFLYLLQNGQTFKYQDSAKQSLISAFSRSPSLPGKTAAGPVVIFLFRAPDALVFSPELLSAVFIGRKYPVDARLLRYAAGLTVFIFYSLPEAAGPKSNRFFHIFCRKIFAFLSPFTSVAGICFAPFSHLKI